MPRGLLTGVTRAAVSGKNATATVPPVITRATSHANGLQRGEGSLPSGNSKARKMKGPKCTIHTHEETQASASPPSNTLGHEPGSANSVAIAYTVQNNQPMGFRGGRRGAMMAPTGEKLTAITVFSGK